MALANKTDVEVFISHNSKGREIEGLDFDSEKDYENGMMKTVLITAWMLPMQGFISFPEGKKADGVTRMWL